MNKTIIGLIIAGILLISIPIGVRLVQQQQILKSKAAIEYNYQCGDAQKCANPETEGDPGLILCAYSCTSQQNQCKTERSCGDPVDCRGGVGCPGSKASCPSDSPNGSVKCDEDNGVCYSDCGGGGEGACPVDGGYYWDGTINKCIHKTGGAVWTTDNQCHYNYDQVPGTANNCPGTAVTPPPATVPNPAPPGSVATQCNGTKTWAEIWGGLEKAGWNATKPWNKDAALAKYNELSCASRGGGGLTKIYVEPNPVAPGGDVKVTATAPTSCSTNINMSSGAGIVGCGAATGQTCSGGSPKSDNNPCWWQWQCKGGATAGNYTATFNASGSNCSSSAQYSVTVGGGPPSLACPAKYRSTEVRFQFGTDTEWRLIQSMTKNDSVKVGAFHNEGEEATDVTIKVSRPGGTFPVTIENKSDFKPDREGTYTFTAKTKNPVDNVEYSGAACTSSVNLVVNAGTATPTPTPTPTPAPSDTCDVTSTQVRMRHKDSDAWRDKLDISLGDTVFLAGFYNGQTETPAAAVDIEIEGPLTKSNSHKVPPPPITKNSDNTFSYKIPDKDGIGDYKVTATKHGKTGVKCIGTGTISVSGPSATTTHYRIGESLGTGPESVYSATYLPYTANGMLADYTFKDANVGQKYVYVQFKDSNSKEGGCNSDYTTPNENGTFPCRMQIKYIDSATISNCSVSFDGSATIINLTGNNFGVSSGSVKGTLTQGSATGTGLSIKSWENNLVSARWADAPQGKILYITLTTANSLKALGTCSPVSSLALGVKVFCRASSSCARPKVDLTLKDVTTGEIVANQKVTIDANGVIQGFNQKLIADRKYILSLKAPKSLRRNREFTAVKNGGTTNIPDFVLPMGDINSPDGEGDGIVAASDYSLMVRDWNIGSNANDKLSDLDCNRRVNSVDWACLRYDYNKESDPALVPGVTLTDPNVTPVPGATGTPAPAACTLGMYVKFDGISNAAYSARPVVTLGLFPPGATIRSGTQPPSPPLGYLLSSGTVSVTASTVPTHQQDVFLITSGTNTLTCGEKYDVVVMSSVGTTRYKLSRFMGIPVVDNPSLYPTFFYSNQPICRVNTTCSNNCLDNDPDCVIH